MAPLFTGFLLADRIEWYKFRSALKRAESYR